MGNISNLTAWHKSQIGTKENPPNSNNVRYNTIFYGREVSGDSYPWCCAYVWCGFYETKLDSLILKTAGCTQMANWAREQKIFVTENYREGDLILYSWTKNPFDVDHIGYCINADADGVTCIEGNTSDTSADNGGNVMKTNRSYTYIVGAVRPKYDDALPSTIEVSYKSYFLSRIQVPNRGWINR